MNVTNPTELFLTRIAPGVSDPTVDRILVERCLLANGALLDLGEGLIQPADFLDTLEFAGHDMDSTLAIFEENATRSGYW